MYDTDPSSSSSSSSSSSNDSNSNGSSAADPNAPPPSAPWADKSDSVTPTRRRLPKVDPRTDDDRVTEDLSVAKFYEDRGDLNAAYMRAKDAVKVEPKDAESHFVLARISQKLQKRDEAIAEFNNYLKIEPDGDKVKQARKALTQLQ
jgi:tetratricopeptide (TPR) repeat protein